MTSTPDDPEAPSVNELPAWSPAPPAEEATAPPMAPPAPSPEPLNPWLQIWTQPRAVARQMIDTRPGRLVHLLAMGGGMAATLLANVPRFPGFTIPLGTIVVLKIVLGSLTGLIALYLFSALVLMTGRWLGGRGTFVAVRCSLAWSNVPAIWAGMLWLPLLGYLGWQAFNLDTNALLMDPTGRWLMAPILLAAVVLAIWRLVICCKCVGEAHGFSAWHSFGAFLISLLIVAIPVVILAAIIGFAFVALLTSH